MQHKIPSMTPPATRLGEHLQRSKYGWRMNREQYAIPNRRSSLRIDRDDVDEKLWDALSPRYRDPEHREYTDGYLLGVRELALMNYDLCVRSFCQTDPAEFEQSLNDLIAIDHRLTPVTDLHEWEGTRGVYVLVFDDYRQFYIGESVNIRRRVKQHWTKRTNFDRLLWGSWDQSILSVDSFRALDNTRVFAAKTRGNYTLEEKLERKADRSLCLNRIQGGELEDLRSFTPRFRQLMSDFPERTQKQCREILNKARTLVDQNVPDIARQLAGMDLSTHVLTADDGGRELWSLRAELAQAALFGAISAEVYADFLHRIGEDTGLPA